MRINHNIAALNTYRQLSTANNAQSKSMEKLSSGLRINRAGDDAAGLAISEKMRAQIRGLDMAAKNAQDGISLIQTAEGALSETHSILQRMRELAVQSANDTNTETDRAELQKEVDQLAEELTRIAENTEFNTQNLLGKDGNGFSGKFHIGANSTQNISLDIADMGAKALGVIYGQPGPNLTLDTHLTLNSLASEDYTIKYTAAKTGNNDPAVDETTAVVNENDKTITITLKQAEGTGAAAGAISATLEDVAKALEETGLVKVTIAEGKKGTTAQVQEDATLTKSTFNPDKGIDISSQGTANGAITVIDKAIEKVSAERSKLGAVQNRLEHTINNLQTSSENLTAAESRIRDVDMAKELMEQTKNSILAQASQAMLAQANQQPQGVLQLLR